MNRPLTDFNENPIIEELIFLCMHHYCRLECRCECGHITSGSEIKAWRYVYPCKRCNRKKISRFIDFRILNRFSEQVYLEQHGKEIRDNFDRILKNKNESN